VDDEELIPAIPTLDDDAIFGEDLLPTAPTLDDNSIYGEGLLPVIPALDDETIFRDTTKDRIEAIDSAISGADEKKAAVIDVTKRPAGEDLEAMDFEERVEYLKKVVVKNPPQREIKYRTLRFCCERRILPEVEEFIAACPEYDPRVISPYFLLQFLLKGGGLFVYELDADGEIIVPEQKEGLTEDEIDDLVAELAFECNEYGRELVERMSPKNRILELLSITPEYYDTFIEVLDFLTEKRTFAKVDTLLRGRDVLMVGRDPGDRPIQPSVFVDRLEEAGGIFWEKGWLITEDAKELLETLKERRA